MPMICDILPDFSKLDGLVAVITQDAASREVLMLAFMNEEAWRETLRTGEAHYYSRSRGKLWHKGEESGHTQKVIDMRIDCDGDVVLLLVEQTGGIACHTGRHTCFYRQFQGDAATGNWQTVEPVLIDPEKIYKK